jgi:hypothetical protein
MANRTGNYCAFYVKTPFSETNLGANTAKDFVYYRTLRMWKGSDASFPFVDSHDKNYNVRDDSDWESTLKPRLTRVWQKWRFSAPQTHLWVIKHWFSALTFVVKIATFAKPENVSGNIKTIQP